MQNTVGRLFRLRPGELSLVITLGLLLLCNSLAMQMSEIAAISNFLSAGGVNQILLVWMVDAALTVGMTGIQSLIIDRFDRVSLIRGLTFGFAMAFVVLRVMFLFQLPTALSYSLLYLIVGQQTLVFPLIFWILANDLLEPAQTKRLFPVIAGWGLAGKLLGICLAAVFPALLMHFSLKPEELLLLNVFVYMCLYALVNWGLNSTHVRTAVHKPETTWETLTEGWNFVRDVPSFRCLMLSIGALVICETVIEFRFLVISNAAFPDPADYQTFYSAYYLIRILISLLVQTFLTGQIIEKVGLKNSFLILPILAMVSASLLMVHPGWSAAMVAMLLQKVPQYSVDESSRKAFQALVPEERRGRVSIFMDNYLYAGGAIAGCIATGCIILFGNLFHLSHYAYGYIALGIVASAVAIWAIARMRQVYDASLLNWRLKRRQRGKSILDKLEF